MILPKPGNGPPILDIGKKLVFVPTIRGGASPATTIGQKFPKHTLNMHWNLELTLFAGGDGEISLINDTISPPKSKILYDLSLGE